MTGNPPQFISSLRIYYSKPFLFTYAPLCTKLINEASHQTNLRRLSEDAKSLSRGLAAHYHYLIPFLGGIGQ